MPDTDPLIERSRRVLQESRIPPRHHDTTMTMLGVFTDPLKKYMSMSYESDVNAGIGVTLYGDANKIVPAFPVLCRAIALRYDGVRYITLNLLIDATNEESHPLHETISTAPALCVAGMFDKSIDLPLTFIERRRVEDFLMSRSNHRLRNYYASIADGPRMGWWSEQFVEFTAQSNRHIKL